MLDRAVEGLSPTLRSVFVLRDIEGLSTAEVAEALGSDRDQCQGSLASGAVGAARTTDGLLYGLS